MAAVGMTAALFLCGRCLKLCCKMGLSCRALAENDYFCGYNRN